jgi:hypothetical protein
LRYYFRCRRQRRKGFENWYKSHPYYKGTCEEVEIVGGRTTETDGEVHGVAIGVDSSLANDYVREAAISEIKKLRRHSM